MRSVGKLPPVRRRKTRSTFLNLALLKKGEMVWLNMLLRLALLTQMEPKTPQALPALMYKQMGWGIHIPPWEG